MEDWQQRVVEELEALETKRLALRAFISGTGFAALDEQDRDLLSRQERIMGGYEQILQRRIARFPK